MSAGRGSLIRRQERVKKRLAAAKAPSRSRVLAPRRARPGRVSVAGVTRRFVGAPLRSDRLGETLLPKRLALPVFCSDPLSSVAYATEQIILVLCLGGLTLLHLTPWLGAAVVVLLVVVVASYRQTCFAYPNGGGAYAVSRDNLGEDASLVAASAARPRKPSRSCSQPARLPSPSTRMICSVA